VWSDAQKPLEDANLCHKTWNCTEVVELIMVSISSSELTNASDTSTVNIIIGGFKKH